MRATFGLLSLAGLSLAGPALLPPASTGPPTLLTAEQLADLFETAVDYVAAATCLTNTTFDCGSAPMCCRVWLSAQSRAIGSRRRLS